MAQEDEEVLENEFFDFAIGSDPGEKERRTYIKICGGCPGWRGGGGSSDHKAQEQGGDV